MPEILLRSLIPDREAEAVAEMSATRVSRVAARCCAAVFILLMLAGPASELLPADHPGLSPRAGKQVEPLVFANLARLHRMGGWRAVNFRLRVLLSQVSGRLGRDSIFSRWVRPPVQARLVEWLRYGNGQVVVGDGGWFFYQRSLYQAFSPPFLAPVTLERRTRPNWTPYPAIQPDPVAGLVGFERALAQRGIRLVFLPIPGKEEVYPERVTPGTFHEAPVNPSYDELLARLEAAGVAVFDAPRLLFSAGRTRDDLYTRIDTHWTPAGLEITASGLADFLRQRFGRLPGKPVHFEARPVRLRLFGDLATLLGLPVRRGPDSGLEFTTSEVFVPGGGPFLAKDAVAPILLLGDSFSLIYQKQGGVAHGAGFAERLALHLERPVAQLGDVVSGHLAARIRLLADRADRLRAARIVIYEVATRSLSTYDWKLVQLRPRDTPAPRDATVPRGRPGRGRGDLR